MFKEKQARDSGRQLTNNLVRVKCFIDDVSVVDAAARFTGYEFGLGLTWGPRPRLYAVATLRGLQVQEHPLCGLRRRNETYKPRE